MGFIYVLTLSVSEHFSLLHQRMEWAGLDPGGLGPDSKQQNVHTVAFSSGLKLKLKADLAKIKKGVNEYFPYLFGNCGKITELGVSWVFFPPFFLSCVLLHLLPLFPEEKRYKRERTFYSLCKVSK